MTATNARRWLQEVEAGSASFALALPDDTSVVHAAFAIVREEEGFSARAYPDGKGYSIGYGRHGARADEVTTEPAERAWTLRRLAEIGAWLRSRFPDLELPVVAWAVILSWVYNVGQSKASRSRIMDHLAAGRLDEVDDVLLLWRNSGGVPHPGLIARREREARAWNIAIAAMRRASIPVDPVFTRPVPEPERTARDPGLIASLMAVLSASVGAAVERIPAIVGALPTGTVVLVCVALVFVVALARYLRRSDG